MEEKEKVTEEEMEVDKETDKETECIGEVEVAAVVPDVKEEDVPAEGSSKKLIPDKEEEKGNKDKDGSEKDAEERQKETDTDQGCPKIRLMMVIQRYSSSLSKGFIDEELRNSPGWWFVIVATYKRSVAQNVLVPRASKI